MKLTDKIRRFWTKDRAVLMTCIGIALCFWLLNKLSMSFVKNIQITIFYNLPEGKTLNSIPPQYAFVTVRGTGWDILSEHSNNVIRLDLTADSLQMFSLRNAFVQNNFSEILTINPDIISLGIEEAVSKKVKIEPILNLHFDEGFDLAESIELKPAEVTITGPGNFIEKIKAIRTDTLNFLNLKEKVIKKVRLLPHPILKYNIEETEATIIAEQFTEKSLFIPIIVKNAPEQLTVFPNKIKLDCTVALSRYAQLSASNFIAEVDLKGLSLNSANNTVPVILSHLPTYVRNVKFTPKSVEYYIQK
jgi:YbbR domain-containing protein